MDDKDSWKKNQELLPQLLDDAKYTSILIVDSAAIGAEAEKCRIAKYHKGDEVLNDVLEHQQL